jgi:hypothetical protein
MQQPAARCTWRRRAPCQCCCCSSAAAACAPPNHSAALHAVALGGYVLPKKAGDPAAQCTGATYAPNNNRLSACLKCQSGLGSPADYNGTRADRNQVCQVPPGRFWELNVVRDCPKGLYRASYRLVSDKLAIACLPCPTGWTTPGIATPGIGFCNGEAVVTLVQLQQRACKMGSSAAACIAACRVAHDVLCCWCWCCRGRCCCCVRSAGCRLQGPGCRPWRRQHRPHDRPAPGG